eukprot:1147391-Pelagomonas_calceolata.AAC.1
MRLPPGVATDLLNGCLKTKSRFTSSCGCMPGLQATIYIGIGSGNPESPHRLSMLQEDGKKQMGHAKIKKIKSKVGRARLANKHYPLNVD